MYGLNLFDKLVQVQTEKVNNGKCKLEKEVQESWRIVRGIIMIIFESFIIVSFIILLLIGNRFL